MQSVFRIEAAGESAVQFPSLADAMRLAPQSVESHIATSAGGVHLADAEPIAGAGTMLRWRLTLAGRDVADKAGWAVGGETVASGALRESFESVAS